MSVVKNNQNELNRIQRDYECETEEFLPQTVKLNVNFKLVFSLLGGLSPKQLDDNIKLHA